MPIFSKNARKNADEMIIAKTLGERKAGMLERADVIVVLPGGLGTLDEATEVLELKKQHHHDKPVIILNTAGFYDGLKFQLKRMSDEGFLKMNERNGIRSKTLDQFVSFVDTSQQVTRAIA